DNCVLKIQTAFRNHQTRPQ
ncbi:unnamed protein product, partial [Rotaria sp. Silwood1]